MLLFLHSHFLISFQNSQFSGLLFFIMILCLEFKYSINLLSSLSSNYFLLSAPQETLFEYPDFLSSRKVV